MILDLHRQGLSISAIARRTGRDPKTIRKYIARGLEPPVYGPRRGSRSGKLAPYRDYLRERVTAFPDLSAVRLTREIRERGYEGAYTAVKRFLCAIRPADRPKPFEIRFETPAGQQAQVDFARFVTVFTDQPEITRIVWLFSLVLGHSRYIFARFVLHQDLQTLLRCHMLAFESIGGVPLEILYDRMKTAVTGEDGEGHIIYNRALLTMAQHYGFLPKACRAYRAKTKGKVERPFSYIRQDFFLARSFRNLDDLNTQLRDWLDTVANARLHGTTQRIVAEAFAAEQPELQPLPPFPFDALLKLPLASACRAGSRARAIESPNYATAGTKAPRPTTRRDIDGSSDRLITGDSHTHQVGKIEGPQMRKLQRPLTPGVWLFVLPPARPCWNGQTERWRRRRSSRTNLGSQQ